MKEIELTNAIRKAVRRLDDARHRRQEGCFVAEGTKCVLDTIAAFPIEMIVATPDWLSEHSASLPADCPVARATRADLERMSLLKTASPVMAVYRCLNNEPDLAQLTEQLVLALDRVQDPGNLGTIIRVADWMGIRTILASHSTVDVYNPKVVQATMGSIARVRVCYCDLEHTLSEMRRSGTEIYITALDGEDIYNSPLSSKGVIVMGNEGRGVSDQVASYATKRLLIPPYPADAQTAESLNVAIATALSLGEFRRRQRQ